MNPRPRVLDREAPPDHLEPPAPGSIDLWLITSAGYPPVGEADRAALDAEEQARARAFVQDQHRDRYLAAHVVLRRLLAAYLDQPPGELAFFREACPLCAAPHGRPAVRYRSRPLHFSLSYGTDRVLFGFAATALGVDIEEVPDIRAADEVATALHPDEQRELAALGDGERPRAFGRVWARKEAYLKGTGAGLGDGLAKFYLGSGVHPYSPPGWTLTDLDVGPRHTACAAVHSAHSV